METEEPQPIQRAKSADHRLSEKIYREQIQNFYGIDDLFAPVIQELGHLDKENFLSTFEPDVESLGELDGSINE